MLEVGMKAQKVMSKPDAARQDLQAHVPARYRDPSPGSHQGTFSGFAELTRECGIMRSGYGDLARREVSFGGVM
jgi:hypothetical protein